MIAAIGDLANQRLSAQGRESWAALLIHPAKPVAGLVRTAENLLRTLASQAGFEVVPTVGPAADLLLHLTSRDAATESSAFLRGLGKRVVRELDNAAWLGIGMPKSSPDGAARSAREAAESVAIGRRVWSGPRSVLYSDVLPFLALSADLTLCGNLARVLDPVESYDRRKRAKLLVTLERLVEENWSVAAASRNLKIHRHTVEYRLKKAESVLALDLVDGRDRFLVESAVAARRLTVPRA